MCEMVDVGYCGWRVDKSGACMMGVMRGLYIRDRSLAW